MPDATLHEFPGQTITLSFEAPEEITDELELTRIGLDAIDAFNLWVEPLAAELSLGLVDTNIDYPVESPLPATPQWLVRRETIAEGIRIDAMLANPVVETRADLTTETLYEWIASALSQAPPEPQFRVTWRELRIGAVRVAVPAALGSRKELVLTAGNGELRVPVDRDASGAWVSGPLEQLPTEPPIALRITNTDGYFVLQISRHWSIWTSGAGATDIDESVQNLTQRGWSLGDD
jgi:hypothetical protein